MTLTPLSDFATLPSSALEICVAEDKHCPGVYVFGRPAYRYVSLEYADYNSTIYHICCESCELKSERSLCTAGSSYCLEEYHSRNLKEI